MYLERLRKELLGGVPGMIPDRSGLTKANSSASCGFAQSRTPSKGRSSTGRLSSVSQGGGASPRSNPLRNQTPTYSAAGPHGVSSQLQHMASTCDDAVRRIDELDAVTQQLLDELGLGGSEASILPPGARQPPALTRRPEHSSYVSSAGSASASRLGGCSVSSSTWHLNSAAFSNLPHALGGGSSSSTAPAVSYSSPASWPAQVPALPPFTVDSRLTADSRSSTLASMAELSVEPGSDIHASGLQRRQMQKHEEQESHVLRPQPEQLSEKQPSQSPGPGPSPEALPEVTFSLPSSSEAVAALESWVARYVPALSDRGVSYPCGTEITFSDLIPRLAQLLAANEKNLDRLRESLQPGHFLKTALQIYSSFDCSGAGCLAWSRGQLRDFVCAVFRDCGLEPPSEALVYEVYTYFDPDRHMSLDAQRCLCLADALARTLQAAGAGSHKPSEASPAKVVATTSSVAPAASSPYPVRTSPATRAERSASAATDSSFSTPKRRSSELSCVVAEPPAMHPVALAERWVAEYVPLRLDGTVSIAYSTGVDIVFADFAPVLGSFSAANAVHRERMVQVVESGEFLRTALQIYRGFDDSEGRLSWRGGAIHDFACAVFAHYELELPSTSHVAVIYDRFAKGQQQPELNVSECLCLVDALCRTTFYSSERTSRQREAAVPVEEISLQQKMMEELQKEQAAQEALREERAELQAEVAELRRAELFAQQQRLQAKAAVIDDAEALAQQQRPQAEHLLEAGAAARYALRSERAALAAEVSQLLKMQEDERQSNLEVHAQFRAEVSRLESLMEAKINAEQNSKNSSAKETEGYQSLSAAQLWSVTSAAELPPLTAEGNLSAEARRALQLLGGGNPQELARVALRVYREQGQAMRGHLFWRGAGELGREVWDFLADLLGRCGLQPLGLAAVAQMAEGMDKQGLGFLDAQECLLLADAALRKVLSGEEQVAAPLPHNDRAPVTVLPRRTMTVAGCKAAAEAMCGNGNNGENSRAEAASRENVLPTFGASMLLKAKTPADGSELPKAASSDVVAKPFCRMSIGTDSSAATWGSDGPGGSIHGLEGPFEEAPGGTTESLSKDTIIQASQKAFQACDRSGHGFLTWSEIKDFVAMIFDSLDLAGAPSEGEVYKLYARFDEDHSARLKLDQCQRLAEAALTGAWSPSSQLSRCASGSEVLGAGFLYQSMRLRSLSGGTNLSGGSAPSLAAAAPQEEQNHRARMATNASRVDLVQQPSEPWTDAAADVSSLPTVLVGGTTNESPYSQRRSSANSAELSYFQRKSTEKSEWWDPSENLSRGSSAEPVLVT
eukprot:TRINITY_DN35787_c0_g1_i1.p1 TRINITY_DN35787_c0_g1~~TRINITY_DN35787_c0_g1_i1.p1  ORF type:complete len:1431 (+),score=296.21 TRINITY_DN35787_c0_g1_i1:374-4294(+)